VAAFHLSASPLARLGTRRFGTRAYVAVRPTTATFSSYANFVNMLFSRLPYPSPMPLCCPAFATAAERKRRRALPKAIIRDNQLAGYYVKLYQRARNGPGRHRSDGLFPIWVQSMRGR